MEMILVTNGKVEIAAKTIQSIVEIETELKRLKAKSDQIKAALYEAMEANNVYKIDTPVLSVQYKAPTFRESFDTKGFKKAFPETYDKFCNISPVKGCVVFKIK